jgi:hypothetical protein
MFFVGTILMSLTFFCMLIGMAMFANAAFNLYVIFKYPAFEDVQRQNAENELKDLIQSNPAFAQKALAFGFTLAATSDSGNSAENSKV